MKYFRRVASYETYANADDDFHFNYNANSGGGQAFLAGRFSWQDGKLASPQVLEGKKAVFRFAFEDDKNERHDVSLLSDGEGEYSIKARAVGSSQMKLGVDGHASPSKMIAAFLMLPSTCGTQKSQNLMASPLCERNFWLQSMWLACNQDEENPERIYFVPRDFVVGGGLDKTSGTGTAEYFCIDAPKRINDIIRLSKNETFFSETVQDTLKLFSDIYLGKRAFSYEECSRAIENTMREMGRSHPEEYSGIMDPLLFLDTLANRGNTRYDEIVKEDRTGKAEYGSASSGIVYKTKLPQSKFPLNRIIFGAPGTGKSFRLNKDKDELLQHGGDYERVTFHPDYTYAQFVGTYKPVTDDEGEIKYEFVQGPFMRVYAEALKDGKSEHPVPHLLIIEEINRARVASVFGDVFQLLDRNKDGVSQYGIQASEDIKKYLARELHRDISACTEIKLPNNMFIWATMNSADQGVFPMDTAFKRRWDFEYLGVDDNEDKVNCNVELVKDRPDTKVNWNAFRKAINKKLTEECHLNEDKLLGPFFLSGQVLAADGNGNVVDAKKFRETFKNKVIMYLFEDAARQYRQKFFKAEISDRYSHICTAFDTSGMAIFGDDFKDYYDHFAPQENS